MRYLSLSLLAVLLYCPLAVHASPLFSATPLTDFAPGEKYLGVFYGHLYANSNNLPAGSQHDLDGRSFAAKVKPLDASGGFDPADGKIVVVGLGMSNWTLELCVAVQVSQLTIPPCTAGSFFKSARANPAVNNSSIVFIDCAAWSQVAPNWVDDSHGLYSRCSSILGANHVTQKQVQVILWKDVNTIDPIVSLSPTTKCSSVAVISAATPDACKYEHNVAKVARFVKAEYPNVQLMFLHSRIYTGYATNLLNPEPYAYENGFATKWLIQAQIDQIQSGHVNTNTRDLSYTAAPWLAWGPYFWADGPNPRSDGLTWTQDDFSVADGTHPSQLGVEKVSRMMLHFYLNSRYSAWFVAP